MSDTPTGEHEIPEVEEVQEVEHAEMSEATGAALAVRPPGREVLMPMDVDQVVAGMEAYQQLLPRLLAETDYQDAGKGKRFVKKSGWRKIARAFNLSVVKISMTVARDAEGNPVRAEAVYRAIAPNGQSQDGDGYCSVDEPRFAEEKGKQKIENDLRTTATTRAKNRAISDLVGMGEVSAEEVSAGAGEPDSMPAATKDQNQKVSSALCYLLPNKEAEAAYHEIVKLLGGTMYGPVADAVSAVINAREQLDEAKG